MEDQIRQIVVTFGRLSKPASVIGNDDDLYDAGLSSLATVNVMLAIEEAFDIEFPDHLLTRRSFQTVAALAGVVRDLKSVAVAS